ncbi:MAG: hypothetical protein RBU29_08140, partial [bacterium]|nr:hypothetical protein [bacterium]
MKRRIFGFYFLHGLALLGLTPSSFATSARPGVRAVYGVSDKKPPFDTFLIDQIPPWLLQHGINAVFLPASASTAMLQALRQAEIRCFLEVPVFSSRSHYRAHPEWRPITASGEEMKPDGWYHGLCPNQPALRELRLKELEKRLRYSLFDGYWLDFIRYPVHWEKKNPRIEDSCFCPECLRRFKAFASLDLPSATPAAATQILERHLPAWVRFRIHTIASWVA